MDLSRRREPVVLLASLAAALIVSGILPRDRFTWFLEEAPIFVGVPILVATYWRFPLTPLAYRLIFIHALILMLGGHYAYAEVPLGHWMKDLFGFARNHYDRIGHFAQSFVPASWPARSCCEFVEWGTAVATGSKADAFLGTQGVPWDTQWDMLRAPIGSATSRLVLSRRHERPLAMFGVNSETASS